MINIPQKTTIGPYLIYIFPLFSHYQGEAGRDGATGPPGPPGPSGGGTGTGGGNDVLGPQGPKVSSHLHSWCKWPQSFLDIFLIRAIFAFLQTLEDC